MMAEKPEVEPPLPDDLLERVEELHRRKDRRGLTNLERVIYESFAVVGHCTECGTAIEVGEWHVEVDTDAEDPPKVCRACTDRDLSLYIDDE